MAEVLALAVVGLDPVAARLAGDLDLAAVAASVLVEAASADGGAAEREVALSAAGRMLVPLGKRFRWTETGWACSSPIIRLRTS